MTDYLVVSVHDLRLKNRPHEVEHMTVSIGFGTSTPSVVTTLSDNKRHTRQIECPTSAEQVRVLVETTDDTFWDADMTVKIVRDSKKLPSLDRSALRLFNVTDLIAYRASNAVDWVMKLEVTVSQLRDYESTVKANTAITTNEPYIHPSNQTQGVGTTNFTYIRMMDGPGGGWIVPDSSAPHLIKSAVGTSSAGDKVSQTSWARIAHAEKNMSPTGRMYFAQHKNRNDPNATLGPRHVAIWRPSFVEFQSDALMHYHGFHLFFHPFIQKKWKWALRDYCDLSRRYLFTEMGMVQQHFATSRKVCIVMPVGSDENQMGELSSWSAAERLLRESLFFMLRKENASALTIRFQRVGHVALSGYSWGINSVNPILESAPGDSELREVYSFDGIEHAGRSPRFNAAVAAWIKKTSSDDDPRWFRVYTQDPLPDPTLAKLVCDNQPSFFNTNASTHQPAAQRVTVQTGWDLHTRDAQKNPVTRPTVHDVVTQEWEDDVRTLLSAPHVAWQGVVEPKAAGAKTDDGKPIDDVGRFYDNVHHPFFPQFFPFHAIDKSGFAK